MTFTWQEVLGIFCIILTPILEFMGYYKQIAKTLRTKKSGQVSSSAYLFKALKYVISMIGLAIYSNWVGFGLDVAALGICIFSLAIVARYKPKGWQLFDFLGKNKKRRKIK